MPIFDKEFANAKGMPIEFHGNELLRLDRIPLNGKTKILVSIEAVSSHWRQGVRLKCDGTFIVNGRIIPGKGGFVLWQDTASPAVEVELIDNATEVLVYNVWDMGDGTIHSWHNGAAMIVDKIFNGRRYRCNDGEADEDFDDIVFRVEHIC